MHLRKMVGSGKKTWRRAGALLLAGCLLSGSAVGLTGCAGKNEKTEPQGKQAEAKATQKKGKADPGKKEETEIQVFIAASLNTVMTELAENYEKEHPKVKITYNADSSGTLLTQIEEGYECDIFFSAAQKQMDQLEADGLIADGTRKNVVNNQVVLLTRKDSGTEVTGLEDLDKAKSIALVNIRILPETEDVSKIRTEEVSKALGGVEISEQDNVSKVLIAVTEGSCEVGTTYYSDTYGYEDQVKVLQTVSYDLTGNVIYPICQVENKEADDAQKEAAAEFLEYVVSDEAKAIFESYYFDTQVE